MLTVKKTSVMREETVVVAQPYGEHRESTGFCQGGAGSQEKILRGKAEQQRRMTVLAGGNPQGPNPVSLRSRWLSWPAAPSGSRGPQGDYQPGQTLISVKLMDTKAGSASEEHPSFQKRTGWAALRSLVISV